MMRAFILSFLGVALACQVAAQDFVSRFLEENSNDTTLVCVSISPKMMEEILKTNSEDEDEPEMKKMISKLRSMQMIEAATSGEIYFNKAETMLKQNANRFTPYLAYNEEQDNFCIMLRKQMSRIVELVMLRHQGDAFVVINFTGDMNEAFISRIADSITGESPETNETL